MFTNHSRGLDKIEILPVDKIYQSIYAQASTICSATGEKLDFPGKVRLIDNLSGFAARIDISGGDSLTIPNNLKLLQYASNKLGRHNVTLTVTGAGSNKIKTVDIT